MPNPWLPLSVTRCTREYCDDDEFDGTSFLVPDQVVLDDDEKDPQNPKHRHNWVIRDPTATIQGLEWNPDGSLSERSKHIYVSRAIQDRLFTPHNTEQVVDYRKGTFKSIMNWPVPIEFFRGTYPDRDFPRATDPIAGLQISQAMMILQLFPQMLYVILNMLKEKRQGFRFLVYPLLDHLKTMSNPLGMLHSRALSLWRDKIKFSLNIRETDEDHFALDPIQYMRSVPPSAALGPWKDFVAVLGMLALGEVCASHLAELGDRDEWLMSPRQILNSLQRREYARIKLPPTFKTAEVQLLDEIQSINSDKMPYSFVNAYASRVLPGACARLAGPLFDMAAVCDQELGNLDELQKIRDLVHRCRQKEFPPGDVSQHDVQRELAPVASALQNFRDAVANFLGRDAHTFLIDVFVSRFARGISAEVQEKTRSVSRSQAKKAVLKRLKREEDQLLGMMLGHERSTRSRKRRGGAE